MAASGSRPQATNATPPAPAKSQSQHIKYKVPLLDDNGDDYTHWCKMVTLVLEHRGFWDVVDGSTPAPDPVTDAQANVDWCRCDKEAQIQLQLALSCAPCNHVLDVKTLKEIWDLLKARYQGDDELRQHYLLERLFMNSFLDTEVMELQIAEVVSITCQLTDISFPVSDQWLTGMIKVKLPATWDILKTVLSNTGQSQ